MTAPYRDDFAWIRTFGQHIGVADVLLRRYLEIPTRIGQDLHDAPLQELQHEAQLAWEGFWDHLGQARGLATAHGRDVTAYDQARTAAGDIFANAIAVEVHARQINWIQGPTGAAVAAINALRGAVPEAVVSPVTSPPRQPLAWWWPPLIILGALAAVALIHLLQP